MEYRRILVLANSEKKGGKCVAGRLMVPVGTTEQFEEWLRPISHAAEGELQPQHMRLEGGGVIEPLDAVDVPIEEHAGDLVHPEDWRVSGDEWKFAETCPASILTELLEEPASLWLQAGVPADRVTTEFLLATPNHQSLYLIRPKNLRLRYWREYNSFAGRTQKKTRASFSYRDVRYELAFTDPVAKARYCQDYPAEDKPAKEIVPQCENGCVLCVSLTPALNGMHYKIVATLLALP